MQFEARRNRPPKERRQNGTTIGWSGALGVSCSALLGGIAGCENVARGWDDRVARTRHRGS